MSNGTFLHSRFRDYERFFCNLLCCLLCISCHIQSSDPWILIEASLGKGASITFESKWGTQSWRNAVPIRVGPKFNSIYVCLFVCLFDLGFRPKGPEYMLTKMVAQYSQKPWQSLSKVNEELNCDGMLCPLGWAQNSKKLWLARKVCLFDLGFRSKWPEYMVKKRLAQ